MSLCIISFRFLFANFTSSLLIVNSTLLAFAALALLGLGGLYSVFISYNDFNFLFYLFSPRVSFLLFDNGKVLLLCVVVREEREPSEAKVNSSRRLEDIINISTVIIYTNNSF